MGIQLTKSAIDLGIVITDSERSLAFYRDLLGFEHVADMPMPGTMSGTMHRLNCGDTLVKLVKLDDVPAKAGGRGIAGAVGLRYFTMTVSNLEEIMADCAAAEVKIAIPASEIRPGLMMGMVEDPDGNWVEFIQPS